MDYKKIPENRPDSYVVTAGETINGPMQDFLDFPLFYLGPLDADLYKGRTTLYEPAPLDLGFWTDDLVELKRRGL